VLSEQLCGIFASMSSCFVELVQQNLSLIIPAPGREDSECRRAVTHAHCHCPTASTRCFYDDHDRSHRLPLDQENDNITHRGTSNPTQHLLLVISAAASPPPYSTRWLLNQSKRGGVRPVHLVPVADTGEEDQRDQLVDIAHSIR